VHNLVIKVKNTQCHFIALSFVSNRHKVIDMISSADADKPA